MKLIVGEEHVVVRGMRPEENWWGKYQFPLPYNLGDRLVVRVNTGMKAAMKVSLGTKLTMTAHPTAVFCCQTVTDTILCPA